MIVISFLLVIYSFLQLPLLTPSITSISSQFPYQTYHHSQNSTFEQHYFLQLKVTPTIKNSDYITSKQIAIIRAKHILMDKSTNFY